MTATRAHSKPYLFFTQQICERLSVPMSRSDDGTRSYLVLAAVLQEWAEMGFLSAQLPSIAARAGLTLATLERLFPNRDDLHLEALAFGQQLIVEAMKKYPPHDNPMLDLLEFAQHYASILQEPYFKQFSLCQTILVRMDSHVREQASVIALAGNAEIKQFWHDRIAVLIQATVAIFPTKNGSKRLPTSLRASLRFTARQSIRFSAHDLVRTGLASQPPRTLKQWANMGIGKQF